MVPFKEKILKYGTPKPRFCFPILVHIETQKVKVLRANQKNAKVLCSSAARHREFPGLGTLDAGSPGSNLEGPLLGFL